MDDVTALCAAIDAGDDTALPILADALEEAGDPRAVGLRQAIQDGYRPGSALGFASWRRGGNGCCGPFAVSPYLFGRLPRVMAGKGTSKNYPSRSAAYLALAAAIVAAG